MEYSAEDKLDTQIIDKEFEIEQIQGTIDNIMSIRRKSELRVLVAKLQKELQDLRYKKNMIEWEYE